MTRSAGGVVLIGAGLMGRWHAHAIQRVGGSVAAIVDPDLARARVLARGSAGSVAVASLDDLPDDLSIDVAHVCTPTATHAGLLEEVVDRGWHALVEKPVTETADETQRLLERAGDANLMLCPVHQIPFQDGFRRIKRALPTLGPVRHIDGVACSAGGEGGLPETRSQVCLDIVPHALSAIDDLVGATLDDIEWHVVHAADGELRATGAAGGTSVGLLVSMAGRPTRHTLRVVGEGGSAHADLFHGFVVFESPRVSRARKIARPFTLSAETAGRAAVNLAARALRRRPAYPGLLELVARFHGAVRDGGPPPIDGSSTLRVARARDRIREGVSVRSDLTSTGVLK